MKLKKGSAAAKAYMAKIRAKRKKVKKSTIAKPKRAAKKVVKAARKKAAKKVSSIHKDTASHNVRISVVSGVKNIYSLIDNLLSKRGKLKQYIIFNNKLGEHYNFSSDEIKKFKKEIPVINKQITQLKKIAREQEKLKKISK